MITKRQRQVLELLASGLRIKQAADRLGISYGTAKQHSEAALARLGARTTEQAVAIAIRGGLI